MYGFPRSQPRLWDVHGDGEAGAVGVNAADSSIASVMAMRRT
jgi:hypothetical protein